MSPFLKNFLDWFNLKPKIDKRDNPPRFINEGQIWWVHIGENIGSEISGKGEKFSRPVIVYKKLSRYTFLVIPTSTKNLAGNWYVPFKYESKPMIACLHQIRVIDYRRFDDKIGEISKSDFLNIRIAFVDLYTKMPS